MAATSDDYRLGVDVGGTFTDVCVITPNGETIRAKTPSTPQDQSVGVKNGIDKVRAILKEKHNWDGSFSFIHHGTTVATNAILESKGVCAGLIVTQGHKDVLAVRRSQIPGGLGAWINYQQPEPVIPLERTIQVTERMGIDGETVAPVDADKLRADLADLKRQKPDAITISLLNAFKSDAHELEVAKIVREEFGPDVEIVCSAHVLPEAGEYERTVTAAANAVVKPLVKKYLDNLQNLLEKDSKTIRILKSDGGLTSLGLAGDLPVNLLMSGPAGGVQGVVDVIANQTPYKNLITLDMGGTSTDCAIIVDGKAALRRETNIDELVVRAPSVDVRTVGAGGGSIAQYVELTSTMRVGPESAGARPGPACYSKGGKQPTVTDANLALGYLPEKLLGGSFQLDVQAAIDAVKSVGDQVGLDVDSAAEGIINLVNETMFGALRSVSSEQGYDPREFALVCFGGAGPLHANAVGKLLGAWPVIIPPAPGVLCAQGDATTKLRHEQSSSYIRNLSEVTIEDLKETLKGLEETCEKKVLEALKESDKETKISVKYEVDMRYSGQALNLTVPFEKSEVEGGMDQVKKVLAERFAKSHNHLFGYSFDDLEFEIHRIGVIISDASEAVTLAEMKVVESKGTAPPADSIKFKKTITVEGKKVEATFYERSALNFPGCRIEGPCVVSEMDSNTLVLPGYYGEIDKVGNILINPIDANAASAAKGTKHTPESAEKYVADSPLVPTLIASALGAVRNEMDALVLRAAMSPGIREQQDEFNLVTDKDGKMLVGQMGSFIQEFLKGWMAVDGATVEEGDIFITNDPYQVYGAISHLSDVIIIMPIYHDHKLVGWSANFGHLSDVGGCVAGSMSIEGNTIFEDGLQIPVCKLYAKGVFNQSLMHTLTRNSRMPEWFKSDVAALISSCRTAGARVCEIIERFGPEVYIAAGKELLRRNKVAVKKLIDTQFSDEVCSFTDFVDDDGAGVGPWVVKCSMRKENGKLVFDWDGTSPQSNRSLNFYLSETLFKMFCGYYLLAVFDPYAVVNDGFHEYIDVRIPEGCVLKPIRPAALSCRTHLLGRMLDMVQALMGQKNKAYRAAAGFSDSPHFFYSGWKPNGDWFQLYQICFGGVPARPAGDGPDCHCLWPAIKSVPTETIELGFPLRLEVNEAMPDTGGAGFFRGGNAQRTLYRFLCKGEFSIHDDRWFTHPWGIDGGQPGARSKKILYKYSQDEKNPPKEYLQSKCDHIVVHPGDVLEYITWGGGGLGDPLTRPAEKVALETHRKQVTIKGAAENYGVVVCPDTYAVKEEETKALREKMAKERPADAMEKIYNRGGTLEELTKRAVEDTGLPAPIPQWEAVPYGPHMKLPYVKNWYETMREKKGWDLE